MCLVVFAYRTHPDYQLVFVGNRDEFYDRPTAPADFWADHPDLLAGRDLVGGGTWLGVSREGRFALVTNFRDPSEWGASRRSRGLLARAFLEGNAGPAEYLETLAPQGDEYKGYNLVVGAAGDLFHGSNRGRTVRRLEPGLYGISNHLLDTPWPKVQAAKTELERLVKRGGRCDPENLMKVLCNTAPAPDHDLPDTGVGIHWERMLSARFVLSENYGTRCTTVILWSMDGGVEFTERSFEPIAGRSSDRHFAFRLE